MIKRATWFVSGAVAGIAGTGYAKRKVKETASQLAPTNVARTAVAKVRERGHDVAEAVREGRQAKRAREAELRDLAGHDLAGRHQRSTRAPTDVADVVDVDDLMERRLEPGQVVLLSEVREARSDADQLPDRSGERSRARRRRRRGSPSS
jgi:hypothetical protein